MAFCKNCGTELAEGASVCTNCGSATEQPKQATPVNNAVNATAEKAKSGLNKLMDAPDTTGAYDATDIENNKIMALLSYIGILFLIPLFAAKDSKFARFHANQGLVLFIVNIAVSVVCGILGGIAGLLLAFLLPLGIIVSIPVSIIALVLGVIVFVFMILGIVNCVNGKAKELPLIGKFKILK